MFTCHICYKPIVVGGLTVELKTKLVIPVHTSCFLINTVPIKKELPQRKE